MAKVIEVGAGTYDVLDTVAETITTVTVPVLTAGSINEASPQVGDTLNVSGSNASVEATFQWQKSADGSTGITNITGETSANYDTTTFTATEYARRGVSDGVQGPVYTPFVQVNAVSAYTEQGVVFDGSQYLTSAGPISADSANFLYFASFIPSDLARRQLLGLDGINFGFWSDYASDGRPYVDIVTNSSSGVSISPDAVAAGNRIHLLAVGSAGADPANRNIKYWQWRGDTNAWFDWTDGVIPGTLFGFTSGAAANYRIAGRTSGGQEFAGTMFRQAMWTGLGSIPDISDIAVRNLFTDGANLVNPNTSQTEFGTPKLDAYGDATAWNAGNAFDFGGTFTVTGTVTDAV